MLNVYTRKSVKRNIRINKRTRITNGKSRMDNLEKLAILGTQVSLIKIQRPQRVSYLRQMMLTFLYKEVCITDCVNGLIPLRL